jgi:phosphoglycolate phosphatase
MKFLEVRPQINLLIFDLDGTLIDSKKDLALSVNATLEHLGRPVLDEPTIFSYVGQGAPTLIRRVVGDHADLDEVARGLQFFLEYYRDHKLDHTQLYPGARQALEQLANGHNGSARTLAVLTNKPERVSREIIAELGLGDMFRCVYGGNTFDTKKPDPFGLLKLLEETRVDGRAAMIVGDSNVDIQTGRGADVWTCAVSYGFGTLQLDTYPPDLVVHSLPELASALNGNGTAP